MNNSTRKDDYWCHTCSKKIRPRQDKKPEIICSECNGDFVEIMENEPNNSTQNNNTENTTNNNQQQNQQNNNQQPNQHHQFNVGNFFGMPINNIQFINLGDNMNNMGGMGGMDNNNNPLNGIQQFLQMLANRNGENMGGMGGMGLGNFLNFGFPGMGGMGGNMGDYVFGNQQFDEILSRLMEQAKGGAPPASKDALKELRLFNITQKEIDENAECSVCKDEYELDEEVKIMPCNHMFHKDCLDPWLKLRNTCPVCRYELKSKEEKEKDKKNEKSNNNNSNNNNEDMDDDSDSHDEMGFPNRSSSSNNNHYI